MVTLARLDTDDLSPALRTEMRRLLDEAFAVTFTDDDWDHTLGGVHVVALEGGTLLGHAAVVERDIHVGSEPVPTGYVEVVAVSPSRQGEGVGSALMAEAAAVIAARFRLGMLSTSRASFYARLGWVPWRGPTFVREGSALRRTPDEDDGIMALPMDDTIDLAAPVSCAARPGDDW